MARSDAEQSIHQPLEQSSLRVPVTVVDTHASGMAPPVITVRAGDTVEWTNEDSITAHTVTFGTEPQNPVLPSSNVTLDPDGARHGMLTSTSNSGHSGFLQAAPQDRVGLAQASPGVTRFRVTFSIPGTYPYICALHDGLGMKGKVVVLPERSRRGRVRDAALGSVSSLARVFKPVILCSLCIRQTEWIWIICYRG